MWEWREICIGGYIWEDYRSEIDNIGIGGLFEEDEFDALRDRI